MAFEKQESNNPTPGYRDIGQIGEQYSYRPLTCARCGELLSPGLGKKALVCHQCGHRHPFVQVSDNAAATRLQVGDAVAVEWDGLWWPAHIVAVMNAQKTWRIHFTGWAPAYDAEVDRTRIRSIDTAHEEATEQTTVAPAKKTRNEIAADSLPEFREINPFVGAVIILITLLGFAALVLLSDSVQFPNTFGQMYPPAITATPME